LRLVARPPYSISYSFGPGPLTFGVKWLLISNVALFLLTKILSDLYRPLILTFGLTPRDVFEYLRVWQVVTYMFLHADLMHLLFNMLALGMFGVPLERRWGYRAFIRYYFICGVGAAVTTLVVSWLPFDFLPDIYEIPTIGASGAIYGLLVAFGLLFPDQIILLIVFPVPARVYVYLVAALILWSSLQDRVGGTAHAAHLGGMLVGYLYLVRGRGGPWAELKYRMTKWRMNRARKRFGVHPGGRGGWGDRVH
jgi:membrane associated rhomboid family serine protease